MNEKTTIEKQKSLLGLALLSYMMLIVIIMTQMPFVYRWPERIHIFWQVKGVDVISNLILFFPLGFLFRIAFSKGRDHAGLRPLLYGFLLSLIIEFLQVFIADRYPGPADVLCNAAGAWIGARVYDGMRLKFENTLIKRFALDHPLMIVVYLLIPLIWLNEITAFADPSRLWLLPLPGILGGHTIMVVFSRQLKGLDQFHPGRWGVFFFFSFILVMIAFNVFSPHYIFMISIFSSLIVMSAYYLRHGKKNPDNRRFEREMLMQIIPVYAFYLFLLACWPVMLPTGWKMEAGLLYGVETTEIMKLVEYVAAYTLFGYLIAEYRGRREESLLKTRLAVLTTACLFGGLLEVCRGFHPLYVFSLFQLLLILIGAYYGSVVYYLQLNLVKEMRKNMTIL